MFGQDGDDRIDSVDAIVNNDNLNGGIGIETCTSDPDPEEECEL